MDEKAPPARISAGAERKQVTVLFFDLSGHTALYEKLNPEEVKEITARILGEVAHVVSRYEGFVEKCIGDVAVILFGVPKSHEDDHLRAVRAAHDIHDVVNAIGGEYEERIGARLTFHSGIATGLVATGGTNEKGALSVAGETATLASRLSRLAKPGEILVAESTYLQSNGAFSFERLPLESTKGEAAPAILYRLVERRAGPAKGLAIQRLASPLVGRSAEMAAIKASLNCLLDGQGGILSLIGEAGIGKSRLMAETHQAFGDEHLLWLEGKALSYGQMMSYWPFREILRQYAGITQDDLNAQAWDKFERRVADLFPTENSELLPYLASLISPEAEGELAKNLARLHGEAMGNQIYLSSRRFFARLARKPLVLVFEDLQWADESTVALIEHLFPLTTRLPLLICEVSRPETGAPAMRLREAALRDRGERYTEIRLNPLSPTECADLMDNLITTENLPSRARQLILQKAAGNPFFVEEIMRTLVDEGAVRFEHGRWRVTSDLQSLTIPDTTQGVIMARIDRLGKEAKQTLEAASVIGRAFPYRLLKEVTGAVKELDRHLDILSAADLIKEKQEPPELSYIFKHALVQESAYEGILLEKRRELHGNVASAMERVFSERLDELASVLAYHHGKAESWGKAAVYLFKAGDEASAIGADAEALAYYQQALRAYDRVFGDRWDPLQRGIVERKMGEALYRRGEYVQAMEYLQRALVYLGRPTLPVSPGKVWLDILKEIGIQVGVKTFSRWLVRKEPADPTVEETDRVYEVVQSIEVFTAPAAFLRTTLASLNYCERNAHGAGVARQYSGLSFNAFFLSLHGLERFFLRRAIALADQIGDPAALFPAHAISSITDFHEGRLHSAIDHGSKVRDICRRTGYPNLAFWAASTLSAAEAYVCLGDIGAALSLASEQVHMGEDADDPYVYACGLWASIQAQDVKGDFEDVMANSQRVMKVCETIQYHDIRVAAGCRLSRVYLRLGEIEKSQDALIQSDLYRSEHPAKVCTHFVPLGYFRLYLAAAERAGGKEGEEWLKKAKQAGRKALHWAKRRPIILPEATRLDGVYEWLTGRRASAQKAWLRSLSQAEEMGMRYELGMTNLEMGQRFGDREHLKQAESIFAEIGASFDLAETRRFLKASTREDRSS